MLVLNLISAALFTIVAILYGDLYVRNGGGLYLAACIAAFVAALANITAYVVLALAGNRKVVLAD